jgi:hypothetical protein
MTSMQPIAGVERVLFSEESHVVKATSGAGELAITRKTTPPMIPDVASSFLQGLGVSLPKGMNVTWKAQDLSHRK